MTHYPCTRDGLNRFTGDLFRAVDDDMQWRALLQNIATNIGASSIAIYCSPPGERHITRIESASLRAAYRDPEQSPRTLHTLSQHQTAKIEDSVLPSPSEPHNCAVDNALFPPNNLTSQLVWPLSSAHFGVCTFVAMRDHSDADFQREHRDFLDLAMPQIRKALELRETLRALKGTVDTLEAALSKHNCGVALLTQNLHLVFHNREFRNFLYPTGSMRLRGRTLSAGPHSCSSLPRLVERVKRQRIPATLPLESGATLRLEEYEAKDTETDAELLLTVRRHRHPDRIDTELIQAGLQLTPAEARLACSLAIGYSLNEHAMQQRISKHTARGQLKSIFRKTGIGTQKNLVATVVGMCTE